MNFYNHHLGDYDGATLHLSWDEDMAYSRLLRAYYRREKAIPDAEKYRLTRATTRPQRAAVDAVLAEFFDLREDGWHNKRADEEIAAYREDGAESEAKKENERERQRRHRERRKQLFEALRAHGIVPKWDTALDDLQRMLDAEQSREQQRTGNGDSHVDDNAPVTQPVTRTATAIQEPVPIPSTQEPRKVKSESAAAPRPDWLPEEWDEFERHRREKNAKFTPTARAGCIRRLEAWRAEGKDIRAILRHSIDNGYTGLFEPKNGSAVTAKKAGVTEGNIAAANEFLRRTEGHESTGS